MNSSDVPDFGADLNGLQQGVPHNPPPRPPKPATLSRSKLDRHESTSSVSLLTPTNCYDIPKTAAEKTSPGKGTTERQRTTSTPRAAVAPLDTKSTIPDILEMTVEKPDLSVSERKAVDEAYDIPVSGKVVHVVKDEAADILDATVALHPSSRCESGRHAYFNSAPGFRGAKDSVFIYEYRPSLPTTSDDNQTTLYSGDVGPNDSSLYSTDRSPRTPNSGFSEATPPAVDRNLKPRRKGSDSDTTASPTTPNPFLLKPAPDGRRQSGGRLNCSSVVRGCATSSSTLPSARTQAFAGNNNG